MKYKIDESRLEPKLIKKHAEGRAKWIRAYASTQVGYSDGYADGFEHALQWLLRMDLSPLELDYRKGSGFEHAIAYYKNHPEEAKKAIADFEDMTK